MKIKMKIILNGKERSVEDHISTLDEFIRLMVKSDRGKIIELNGKVTVREERKNLLLNEGDRIEIIQFMGGG